MKLIGPHLSSSRVGKMKTTYGPVRSWRLGRSFGIDPICELKVCSFDCIYCQCGRTTTKTIERKVFVDTELIEQELREYPYLSQAADVATISGLGEPELAKNLGEIIEVAGLVTKLPVAVLTNSSLMHERNVRSELEKADIVCAKLDAPNHRIFGRINHPHPDIDFNSMIDGMIRFRSEFHGKYALQVMFVNENRPYAPEIRKIAEEIQPDEVQINTPSRANKPKLTPTQLEDVTRAFKGMNYVSYYEAKKPPAKPFHKLETLRRRPT